MTLFMDNFQLPFIVVHFSCLSLVVMEFFNRAKFELLKEKVCYLTSIISVFIVGADKIFFTQISDLSYACYFKINENQP